MSSIDTLLAAALAALNEVQDVVTLEQVKARYLGKSGEITELLKQLGKLPPEEKKQAGQAINAAKQQVEAAIAARREALAEAQLAAQLAAEALDVTLPGRGLRQGGLHPVTLTLERITSLFRSLGFEVADGPEIETDFHNFQALNIPENHPARAMADTFYVEGGDVLRTHTSPIQIRYMLQHQPPIKIIAPGRVYRVDSDATPRRCSIKWKVCGWMRASALRI